MIGVSPELLETLAKSQGARRIDQPILDDSDPVEAALGLSRVEKDRIESRWNTLMAELRETEVRSLNAEDLDDGSVHLELPDLSRERGRMASGFKDDLVSTLGRDRAAAFSAMKQVDGMFAANAGERSITIKIESVGQDQWGYRMTLEDVSGTRVWVGENIPTELRHLADKVGIFPTITEALAGQ